MSKENNSKLLANLLAMSNEEEDASNENSKLLEDLLAMSNNVSEENVSEENVAEVMARYGGVSVPAPAPAPAAAAANPFSKVHQLMKRAYVPPTYNGVNEADLNREIAGLLSNASPHAPAPRRPMSFAETTAPTRPAVAAAPAPRSTVPPRTATAASKTVAPHTGTQRVAAALGRMEDVRAKLQGDLRASRAFQELVEKRHRFRTALRSKTISLEMKARLPSEIRLIETTLKQMDPEKAARIGIAGGRRLGKTRRSKTRSGRRRVRSRGTRRV